MFSYSTTIINVFQLAFATSQATGIILVQVMSAGSYILNCMSEEPQHTASFAIRRTHTLVSKEYAKSMFKRNKLMGVDAKSLLNLVSYTQCKLRSEQEFLSPSFYR